MLYKIMYIFTSILAHYCFLLLRHSIWGDALSAWIHLLNVLQRGHFHCKLSVLFYIESFTIPEIHFCGYRFLDWSLFFLHTLRCNFTVFLLLVVIHITIPLINSPFSLVTLKVCVCLCACVYVGSFPIIL